MKTKKNLLPIFCLVLFMSFPFSGITQIIKTFTQRPSGETPLEYVYHIRGDYSMIGNTNLTLEDYDVNENNSLNDMVYVDVDSDPTTWNSSSATLQFSTENGAIPECSTIKFAGLYWTGRSSNGSNSPTVFTVTEGGVTKTFDKRKVKIKGPGQLNYTEYTANTGDIYYPTTSEGFMYSAFVEVTDYVRNAGVGEYTIADLALIEGNGGATGYYGGWGLIVVYENAVMNWRDITVFDGHAYVIGGTAQHTLNVTGFNTVQSGNVNMKLGVMAGEGDVGISGDYFQIRKYDNSGWVTLNHSGNSSNNFFNGSVQTGGNPRNPNLQNNTGVDIATLDIPNPGNSVITNSQNSATFRYGSTQDTYIIFCIAMAVDAYIPDVTALISSETINGVPVGAGPITAEPGEIIQYKLQIRNQGTEAVDNVVFTVPIPYTTSYVAGSADSVINFIPAPAPNSIYFDPAIGLTGAIVWDFGTLPLPPVGFPDSVLAELTFELRVTDDCFFLTNPDCPPNVTLTGGTVSGVGAVSGDVFELPFIQGFQASGLCVGLPITDPLIVDIDAANFIATNCSGFPSSFDLIFCDYSGATIPFDSVAQEFPSGLNFYNDNDVTPSTVQYTVDNPFPATPGTHTYFAITEGLPVCAYEFTITVQDSIGTNAIITSAETCIGSSDGAINLVVTGGTAPIIFDWSGPSGFSETTEDISGLSPGNYYLELTDSLGCKANDTVLITTTPDVTSPTISCPSNISVNNDASACGAVVAYSTPVGTDNCPGALTTMTAGLASGSTFPVGVTTVTYQVVDLAGNSNSCSFSVTVTDNENPTISCPSPVSVVADAGNCATDASGVILGVPTTGDNCGVASVTNNAPATYPLGTTTVTWTVTDVNGRTNTCTQTVTVTDDQDPSITCAVTTDQNVVTDAGVCTYTVSGTAWDATASDNCTVTELTYSLSGATTGSGTSLDGEVFNLGTTTVTWTAVDTAGNDVSCSFDVIVTDNQLPSFTSCVSSTQNVNVGTGICTYTHNSNSWNATASDNCTVSTVTYALTGATVGTGSTLNGVTFNLGTTTVTWTVTDNSGNFETCSFDVVVADNQNPVIVNCGAGNQTVNMNTGTCTYTVSGTAWDATATDNCTVTDISYTLSGATTGTGSSLDGVVFNLGTTTVSWTVTDTANNTATCSFTVTVNDNQLPVITSCGAVGPQNVVVDAGACSYTVSGTAWDATATDNCTVSDLSYTLTGATTGSGTSLDGVAFNLGTTTVTWTTQDTVGNTSTCSFTVTVTDDQDPSITCAVTTDQNVVTDAGACTYTVSGTAWDATASDNCTVTELTYSLSGATTGSGTSLDGEVFNLGTTTVTWTAVDTAGNDVSCSFDVIVTDNQLPSFVSCGVGGTQTVNTNNGVCTYTHNNNTWNATASDNCTVNSITYTLTGATLGSGISLNGVVFNKDTTTVTWTVTDNSGNIETCSYDVIVVDNQDPVITSCLTDQLVSSDPGSCDFILQDYTASITYTDNCGATISQNPAPGTVISLGTTTVTITVNDAAGNTDVCEFDVTVDDNENPAIANCPSSISVNTDAGVCGAIVTWTVPTATDNCSAVLTSTHNSGDLFSVGTTTVTYNATDPAGNSVQCTFDVTVTDNEAPTLTNCPSDTASCDAVVFYTIPTATDNCGVQSITLINGLGSGAVFPIGTTTEEWEIVDINGNSSICAFTITVFENPVVSLAGTNVTCYGAADGMIDATVTGGGTTFTFQWNNGETTEDVQNLPPGDYTVITTDNNGCEGTASILITQPDSLTMTAAVENVSCFGGIDGFINLTIAGGTQPYSFQWSNQYTTEDIDTLIAGTYSVIVTDANNCQIDSSFVVESPEALVATSTAVEAHCLSADGALDLTVTGGTEPYIYNWSNSATTQDINGIVAGIYTVTVTDANNCTVVLTDTVEAINLLSAFAELDDVKCYGDSSGTIDLTIMNGDEPMTYNWSNGATTQDISGLWADTYTIVVTDSNFCQITVSYVINQADSLFLELYSPVYPTGNYNVSGYLAQDGSIDMSIFGGTSPYDILWSNGETTEDLQNIVADVYTVIVTDQNGCFAFGEIELTQPYDLEMPTGFTPNGDGSNDFFVIHGIEVFPDNTVEVFNRWGNLIYSTEGYQNDWDGKNNNGEDLPDATYFVVLKIKTSPEDKIITGYVDLRRKR